MKFGTGEPNFMVIFQKSCQKYSFLPDFFLKIFFVQIWKSRNFLVLLIEMKGTRKSSHVEQAKPPDQALSRGARFACKDRTLPGLACKGSLVYSTWLGSAEDCALHVRLRSSLRLHRPCLVCFVWLINVDCAWLTLVKLASLAWTQLDMTWQLLARLSLVDFSALSNSPTLVFERNFGKLYEIRRIPISAFTFNKIYWK